MRVIRNVNRLHISNLEPPGIEGLRRNFSLKTMNIYIYIYIYNSLFSVDIRVLSFYLQVGGVTVGLRAQVAIPGIRMIIWF
jgi:hypothetical protein